MAIVMNMVWNGVTPEQYDQACELVNWENDQPVGGQFHVASFDGTALRVTDMWESAETFQRFVEERLMPGVAKVGIEGEPQVTITEVHRLFTPAYQPA